MAREGLAQIGEGELAKCCAHDLVERAMVRHPRRIGGEARILKQVLKVQRSAESGKNALRRGRDRRPLAVGRPVDVAGGGVLAAVARARAHGTQLIVFDGEELQRAQHRLGGRAVDLLAAPFRVAREIVQGRENAQRAEQAGHGIGDRIAEMQRSAVLLAADLGKTAHRLEYAREARPVAIGPVLAEAGDTQDGEPRIDLLQPCPGDAPAVERARPEILDQNVGIGDQPAEQVAAGGLAEIQRDASLVAIGDLPPQRLAVLVRRQRAQRIARARHLHLDDLGAIVAQQTGSERPGDHGGDVDDFQPTKRAGSFVCHSGVSSKALSHMQ